MKAYTLIFILTLLTISSCFQFSKVTDYANQGFKKVVTKFGQKFWHRNHTDLEETIFETEEPTMDEGIYRASLDTILDVTKNSQRQKEFLECSKGSKS